MASFTGVGDNVELQMADKGDEVLISISGTYNMTILFQREVGSPGSGAWETLRSYTTANATVSETHVTEQENEKLRLIVTVDTSGTATATLADNAVMKYPGADVRDPLGNLMAEWTQGGLRLLKGLRVGPPIEQAGALTLTVAAHAGRTIVFNQAGAMTITLPAATGSGAIFRFFTAVTATGNHVIQVANSSDVIQGGVLVATDTGGLTVPTAATSDTITMNGSTTGGVKGSWLELEDADANTWRVSGFLVSTGAEATPFSAAV